MHQMLIIFNEMEGKKKESEEKYKERKKQNG